MLLNLLNQLNEIREISIAAGNSDEIDERGKIPVVQQKGRFKVTSENVDLEKVTRLNKFLLFVVLRLLTIW